MFNKKSFICFCLIVANIFSINASNVKIAAIVGVKNVITTKDIEDRMKLIKATGNVKKYTDKEKKEMYKQILQALISESLQREVANQFKIQVDDEEINETIKIIAKENGKTVAQLERSLKSKGSSIKTLKNRVRSQSLWGKYIRALCEYKNIKVTKSDIIKYKEDRKRNKNQLQINVSEISIPFHNEQSKKKARSIAYDIYSQLNRGIPFSHLARNFSQSLSRQQSGNIGWFVESSMNNCMKQAVSNIKSGQFTKPISHSSKYIIYRVNNRIEKGETVSTDKKIDVSFVLISVKPNFTESQIQPYAADIEILSSAKKIKDFKTRAKSLSYEIKTLRGIKVSELEPLWSYYYNNVGIRKVGPPNMTPKGILIGYIEREYSEKKSEESDSEIRGILEHKKLSKYASREMQRLFNSIRIDIKENI